MPCEKTSEGNSDAQSGGKKERETVPGLIHSSPLSPPPASATAAVAAQSAPTERPLIFLRHIVVLVRHTPWVFW